MQEKKIKKNTHPIRDTNDRHIRGVLLDFAKHEQPNPSHTLFVQEFALYGGEIRADLAAINGVLHGYEIKSSRDNLKRLSSQVEAYNAVFERATLVSAEGHLSSALSVIPGWWGVIRASRTIKGDVILRRLRPSLSNPAPKPTAIASLLWRPEALQILFVLGLDSGVRSKPMFYLIERLAASVSATHLSMLVRQAIRARGDWLAAARRKQCGGMFQQPANS